MAKDSLKRARKRKRIDTDGDPEFQVAPMVDVLLVLMLFFMMITSTEVLKKNKNLQLANADHGKKNEKPKGQIIVNVAWDGVNNVAHIDLDGQPYDTADGMVGALAARIKESPGGFVLVRSDKDVQYSNIADVMTACANAGIGTVSFAVLTGGNTTHGAPPAAGAAPSN